MKKNLLRLLIVMMATMLSVGFSSCSDDNNDTSDNIIGTWREDWDSGPCDYTAYSFFEDGTGLYFDKGNGAERFTYTMNPASQSVNIVYSESYQKELLISKLTLSILIMDGDEYKKTELTYDMLILGKWLLHVRGDNGTFTRQSKVTFWADGKYSAKDYTNYGKELQGIFDGTWSIAGNRLSINGQSQIAGEYIIDGLVVNGCRLIRASHTDEYPYLVGGWEDR